MTGVSISWEQPALKLLDRRDRYTRNAIMEDFDRDPESGAIEIEPGHFLTPVSDQRFSVIWRRIDGGKIVSVRAVVPLTNIQFEVAAYKNSPEMAGELLAYVKRAVKSESKGEIEL